MKIFHTGDWHIGKLVNGFYMTDDQEYVMEQLFKKIEKEKPDVILIAGDLYDRSVPPLQAVELLNNVFHKIIRILKTPIIALAGNHDSNERLSFGSELLKESGLYISGNLKKSIEKIRLVDEYGPVNFYPIPYADPQIVRDLFEDDEIKTHNDAMNKIVSLIKENINYNERNIAIAHGYVTYKKSNSDELILLEESDSEKPLSIGGTDLINSSCFDGFNYTALGHLHGPQKVGTNKIRYSGSLLKYSFSERKQEKGITIVEIDNKGEIEIEIFNFKPKRDLRIIKGELKELLREDISNIENKEDYIKAVLEDVGELLDPMAKLRTVYPNIMELVREDRLKSSLNNKVVASNIKEKSKFDLFQNFYEDITGEESTLQEIEVITKIINKAEKKGDE